MPLTQKTQDLLDPRTLAAISDFILLARLMVQGYYQGKHQGPKHAFSLEYSKHREYEPGDSLKLVDWKLYGKTDRFFIRQYQEETNVEAWLVLDISRSMNYQGHKVPLNKSRYAATLAAGLAHILHSQKDRLGMILFDEVLKKVLNPSSSERQFRMILRELSTLQPGQKSDFGEAARHAAGRIKKRSLIILFSDLLAPLGDIEKTLKLFLRKGNDLILFHILTHEELTFPFQKFGHFEDMETSSRRLLQPEVLKEEYCKQMRKYLNFVKQTCHQLRISYQQLSTETSFEDGLRLFFKVREQMT